MQRPGAWDGRRDRQGSHQQQLMCTKVLAYCVLGTEPTVCWALSHVFLLVSSPLCFLAALCGGAYDNPRSLISALRLKELNVSFPESHWRQYLTAGFTVTQQPLPRQRRGLALPSLLTAILRAPQPSEPPPFHPWSQPSRETHCIHPPSSCFPLAPQPGYFHSSLACPLPAKREKMERKWIFKDTCIHHYYLHSNVCLWLSSSGGNVNQVDTAPESPKELGSPKLE